MRRPNREAILLARPDVVLIMHRARVDLLKGSIRRIFLAWRRRTSRRFMTLLGDGIRKPDVAARYWRYFADTLARVSAAVKAVPATARLSVPTGTAP